MFCLEPLPQGVHRRFEQRVHTGRMLQFSRNFADSPLVMNMMFGGFESLHRLDGNGGLHCQHR